MYNAVDQYRSRLRVDPAEVTRLLGVADEGDRILLAVILLGLIAAIPFAIKLFGTYRVK